VVVDALRASTTIAVLVRKGARAIPVAFIWGSGCLHRGRLPHREHGSAKVRGFDFGNSPTEIKAAELLPGTTVVLNTITVPG
jgi:2-phosphosulfolactate phosphatase